MTTAAGPDPMPLRSRIAVVGLILASALVGGCRGRHAGEPSPAVDRVLGLMQQRLALMHDVARWKWANGAPISDTAREARVLDAVAERGRGRGLDPASVRRFFAAQMEASKLVQQADFDRWRAGRESPAPVGPDLAASRARIDALDNEILDALAAIGPSPLGPRAGPAARRAEALLDGDGIDSAARDRALSPLR
jgi:chorismate mutase